MLPRIATVKCVRADYMLFCTNDLISTTLTKSGRWEDHILDISKMFYSARPSPLVLDIGANLGAYSIPTAMDIIELGGSVLAFEPQRIIYYQLCANIILNQLDNVFAHHQALGETSGVIEIPEVDYESNSNIGAFSLEQGYRQIQGIESSMKKENHKVEMIALDDLLVDRAPALIKLDVEGLETAVLKGGREFLRKHNYPPIIFEAWRFGWFDEGRKELMDLIKSIGYEVTSFYDWSDHIAQHPENSVRVEFDLKGDGVIIMGRSR